LYVANAGDSRCVVCRDGKAIEMSFDHKPEDDLERERVEKAGGHVTKDGRINNGLNLSRAIGDHSYKANKELPLSDQMITSLPDVKMLDIDLSKDLFMVLACDGIWNFMSSQDVCDFIQERLNANYSKLSQICEELFMHCLAPNSEGDGTGCDNMTCILVTFNPFRKVEFKLNRLVDNNIEKQSLKRSLENGTANIEEIEKNNNTGLNQSPSTLAKKLKQDQQESKHLV
jgi:protein phosphatase 1G